MGKLTSVNKEHLIKTHASMLELSQILEQLKANVDSHLDSMNWNDDLRRMFDIRKDAITERVDSQYSKINSIMDKLENTLKNILDMEDALDIFTQSMGSINIASSNKIEHKKSEEPKVKFDFSFDDFEDAIEGTSIPHSPQNMDIIADLIEMALPNLDLTISDLISGLEKHQAFVKYESDGLIEYGTDEFTLVIHATDKLIFIVHEGDRKTLVAEREIGSEGIVHNNELLVEFLKICGVYVEHQTKATKHIQ